MFHPLFSLYSICFCKNKSAFDTFMIIKNQNKPINIITVVVLLLLYHCQWRRNRGVIGSVHPHFFGVYWPPHLHYVCIIGSGGCSTDFFWSQQTVAIVIDNTCFKCTSWTQLFCSSKIENLHAHNNVCSSFKSHCIASYSQRRWY